MREVLQIKWNKLMKWFKWIYSYLFGFASIAVFGEGYAVCEVEMEHIEGSVLHA